MTMVTKLFSSYCYLNEWSLNYKPSHQQVYKQKGSYRLLYKFMQKNHILGP